MFPFYSVNICLVCHNNLTYYPDLDITSCDICHQIKRQQNLKNATFAKPLLSAIEKTNIVAVTAAI